MKDKSIQNEFIELRADGLSLRDISEKLKVSFATLCKWNKKFFSEIDSLKNEDIKQIKLAYLENHSKILNFTESILPKILKELMKSPVFLDYEKKILISLKLLDCINHSKAEIIKTKSEIEQLNLKIENNENEVSQDTDKTDN